MSMTIKILPYKAGIRYNVVEALPEGAFWFNFFITIRLNPMPATMLNVMRIETIMLIHRGLELRMI